VCTTKNGLNEFEECPTSKCGFERMGKKVAETTEEDVYLSENKMKMHFT